MTNVNLSQLKDACLIVKNELMDLLNKALKRIEALERDNTLLRQEIGKFNEENKKQIDENVESKLKNFKNDLNKDSTTPVSTSTNGQRLQLKSSNNSVEAERLREDLAKVEKMVSEMGSTASVKFVKRLRSKSNKPGPVLVGLSDSADRNPLLLKAKTLREIGEYKSVYVCPDLTEAQRLEDKELRKRRDELNKNRKEGDPFDMLFVATKSPSSKRQMLRTETELSCMYTNATSLENKMNELKLLCDEERPDILAVTETWFKLLE